MAATAVHLPGRTDDRSRLFDEAFLKKLEYLHIVSRKAFTGTLRAERKTRTVGSGIEFADHRRYSMGDDFRYIDWNVYGRVDKLLLRLFEEEEDLTIYLLLDVSRSMQIGEPLKLHYAMQVAAALAYIGLANLDRVAIVPFADELRDPLPPARGKGRIFKVFDFLRAVPAGGQTRMTDCLTQFVHQHKRRGLAVVLSDFYDPDGFEAGLNVLRYNRFEPFVLQIYDRKEADPRLVHGDLTLVDCETGDEREVTVSRSLLEQYAREHERYCAALNHYCTQRAFPYFRTHTGVPFDDLILRIFREGGFLR
ncbi:MAG: DUF58 domain-containing protein [Deltaproteobacteria bacterium]|nr:MAG: DUF58 domain-containing protein [Deltaproteobacteria bacterium]